MTFKTTKPRLGVNRVSGHTSVGFPERLVKQTKLVKTVQGCERTLYIRFNVRLCTLFTKKTEFRGAKRWRREQFKRVSTTITTEFEEVSNAHEMFTSRNKRFSKKDEKFFLFAPHWEEERICRELQKKNINAASVCLEQTCLNGDRSKRCIIKTRLSASRVLDENWACTKFGEIRKKGNSYLRSEKIQKTGQYERRRNMGHILDQRYGINKNGW